MVAAKCLISLCMLGLTGAAPQLFGAPRPLNQEGIVNEVVVSLQPSIAAAVAQALGSLRTASNANAERAQFEAELAADGVTGPAQYNYEYQVRDDNEGTYIFKQENREGDDVTGQYGFIDPFGSLVTVNYQAGVDGFSQSVEQEKNFLRSGGESSSSANSRRQQSQQQSSSRASSFDQNALIAQIIGALQPQIQSTVNSAIAQSAARTQTVSRSSAVSAGAGRAGDRLTPLFGFGQ